MSLAILFDVIRVSVEEHTGCTMRLTHSLRLHTDCVGAYHSVNIKSRGIAEAMDYTRSKGGAALGARLRRLSEAIDRDATRAYATINIRFEQRWFGVLNQLALHGPMTVSELAAALRITRASVSQARQSLEDAGIVETEEHPLDARQRHLVLTALGSKLIRRLEPLWQAMNDAAVEVNGEANNVVAALDRLDETLARKSMFDRIVERLPRPGNAPSTRPAKR